ncbi:alcohol acetyltransferase-domain-containing protein [Desarmillaria tabescens]|uniref:Alcohol acetyltransferase-domain-containing protein n=1 Tax=Armillaria tabescens TaxID=1929756 RepID=A0AA39T659_ARMTA|nr:alcohol acetyltransferase-domain-containing protein [Desarmillaria tabescens]KAK0467156.1 alcohol acetyltransferase-domain-containing protein [Desarmillaria tabescens]
MTIDVERRIRNAGAFEQYHITRATLQLDSCVISAAQYSHAGGVSLSKQVLFPALRLLVQTHGALGVHIVDRDAIQPVFSRLRSVNLVEVVEYVHGTTIDEVLEAQFLKPFDTTSETPLWRLVILEEKIVVLAWHHCIGDGLSGVAFHRTLLKSLQQTQPQDIDSVVEVPLTAKFSPSIESVVNVSPPLSNIIREILNLLLPTSWTPRATAWTGNPVGHTPHTATRVRIMQFSALDVARFHEECRSHKATVTSTLYALAISVLSQTIRDMEPSAKYKTIAASIPISLRSLSGTSEEDMCEHVSTHHTYPAFQPEFSWRLASTYASTLHEQKTASPPASRHAEISVRSLCTLLSPGSLMLRENKGWKFPTSGESSRVVNNAWSIDDMWFAQCDSYVGSALKLNVVGPPSGSLTIIVTGGRDATEDTFVDAFVSLFEARFANIVKSEAEV